MQSSTSKQKLDAIRLAKKAVAAGYTGREPFRTFIFERPGDYNEQLYEPYEVPTADLYNAINGAIMKYRMQMNPQEFIRQQLQNAITSYFGKGTMPQASLFQGQAGPFQFGFGPSMRFRGNQPEYMFGGQAGMRW